MDVHLYHRPDCPFCLKLRIGMAELGISYEAVETKLGEKHPDVLRLSPLGTVPVLVDRAAALVIWESAVALEYVNDRTSGSLFGDTPAQRAIIRMMALYSDGEVGGALRDIIFEKRAKPQQDWDHQRIAGGEARWQTILNRLEGWCGREGFGGDAFTAADCALMARFALAEAYGAGVTAAHPHLYKWYGMNRSRPSVRFSFPEQLPMAGGMSRAGHLPPGG